MTTVYVFGAGASVHAGFPLASEMGNGLLDFMLHYPIEPYSSAAEFLIATFGKSPNIEDLITALQSRIDALNTPEGAALRMKLGNCRGRLTSCLREWFREIHTKPAPAYAEFAEKIIRPGDVLITFNYDDSLERELRRAGMWDVSRGYGFPLGGENVSSQTLVLKLHGSMNWLLSIFGGARSGAVQVAGWPPSAFGDAPVIHPADLQHLGYTTFEGRVFSGGGALECLILPGRKKEFFYDTSFDRELEDFWKELWSQAVKAVQSSDKLVLCGYSLLPVDQRARELLLGAPKEKNHITIVCGSQSERIARDFRAAGHLDVHVFAGGYFEDWVKTVVKRDC